MGSSRGRRSRSRAHARQRVRGSAIAEDDVVVGFLGRLAPQKAPDVALRAFRRILDERPATRVVLAGDGPDGPAMRALASELGLGGRLVALPIANGPDVIPAFDLFLMTSRYEGFPYVLLEALAAGCAIVTTRVGGVVDCVVDGANGTVVDSLDPEPISRAVLDIVNDSQSASAHARRFARACRSLLDRPDARPHRRTLSLPP